MKYLFLTLSLSFVPVVNATDYLLFYLGGQSNMEGFGYETDLQEEYKTPQPDVMIFNGQAVADDVMGGGIGRWLPLSSGHGTGYNATSDQIILSDRFGPELSFGKRMAQLTKHKIAIIKYARGGSSIALGASGFGTWSKNYTENSTINQWDNVSNTVENALSVHDIDGDSSEDKLIPAGIIWMQGEADAYHLQASQVYYQNLTELMNDLSALFGTQNIPIVIGKIQDSGKTEAERVMPFIESVWQAQQKFVATRPNSALVELQQPVSFISDKWHYQSKHYIELGVLFAEAAYELHK